MQWYDWITFWFIVIGALNWGIYGFSRLIEKPFDLVTWMTQGLPILGNILFLIVGLAGFIGIIIGIKLALRK